MTYDVLITDESKLIRIFNVSESDAKDILDLLLKYGTGVVLLPRASE